MKNEKLKCYLCEKEFYALIGIKVASDSFIGDKGVCGRCMVKKDFDEAVTIKHKKFIQEQIDSATERKRFWQTELNEII